MAFFTKLLRKIKKKAVKVGGGVASAGSDAVAGASSIVGGAVSGASSIAVNGAMSGARIFVYRARPVLP